MMNTGYKTVTNGKRFLVFLLDFFFLGLLTSIIVMVIEMIFIGSVEGYISYNDASIRLQEAFYNYLLSDVDNVEAFLAEYEAVMPSLMLYVTTNFITTVVLFVLYFIVIPMLNPKCQTLGRLICKVRIVSTNTKDLSKGRIVGRESMSFLCYQLIPIVGLISGIMALSNQESLVDKASKTRMVNDEVIDDTFDDVEFKDEKNWSEIINAKFDDVTDSTNNEEVKEENNTGSESEDEYKFL